jgi:hypothetical protein
MRFEPRTWAAALLWGAAVGCSHAHILPASDAHVIPGAPTAAVAEENGIRLAADGDDWSGRPADLPERLTPVKVRIVNHSGRPVQILYERFALTPAHGHAHYPLPPVPLEDQHPPDGFGTLLPIYASASFFVAPLLHQIYPSLEPWRLALPRDPDYYQRQYARWPDQLPTREMQRMGLPEGVLADGGQISGFLYFENVTGSHQRLELQAALEDGEKDGPVANLEIPFRVE